MRHASFCALLALLLAAPLYAAPATQPAEPFKIPPLPAFTPDAKSDKWTAPKTDDIANALLGFRIDVLNEVAPIPGTTPNPAPSVRLAWTSAGLAVLAQVHDSTPEESDNPNALWDKDSVELSLSDPAHPRESLQFVIAPGTDPEHPKLRTSVHDYRTEKTKDNPTFQAASAKTPDGYVVEALLPFTALNLTHARGTRINFQISINDYLAPGQVIRYRWGTSDKPVFDPTCQRPLVLADTASEPITFALDGDYQAFRRYRVRINSATTQPQKLTLQADNGDELDRRDYTGGRVHIDLPYLEGRTKMVHVALASGPNGTTETSSSPPAYLGWDFINARYAHLTLLADGKAVATLDPGAGPSHSDALDDLKIRCSSFAFSGTTFPTFRFEDPLAAEDLLGSFTLTTRYYDGHLKAATSASSSGRYFAVVHIAGDNGLVADRIFTLYRYADKLPRREQLTFSGQEFTLPKEFGLPPASVAAQSAMISEAFKRNFFSDLSRSDDDAILLAYLAETAADAPPAVERTNPWSQNSLLVHDLKKQLGLPLGYPYNEFLPANYNTDKDARFPLVIFLHGSGERGSDLSIVKRTGLPAYLEKHPEFPAIVLSPQCPHNGWWQAVDVHDLYEQALAKYRVDPDRVYLTGLSMGGYGTWSFAAWYPETLAAAVPICGIGDAKDVARLKSLPMWDFHGEADPTVPIAPDRACAQALKDLGGSIQFTSYPGVGHDSWTQTYNDPKLYTWLFAQSRKGR